MPSVDPGHHQGEEVTGQALHVGDGLEFDGLEEAEEERPRAGSRGDVGLAASTILLRAEGIVESMAGGESGNGRGP